MFNNRCDRVPGVRKRLPRPGSGKIVARGVVRTNDYVPLPFECCGGKSVFLAVRERAVSYPVTMNRGYFNV
jgi:hypothetical protein